MQVSAHWAVVPVHVSLWINGHFWFTCVLVEPVRNVSSSGLNQGLAGLQMNVLLDELCKVINLVIEAYPAVIGRRVLGHLIWRVVVSNFERSG